MAEEKKRGLFAKFFGPKHSACCEMKIEQVAEEASGDPGARGTVAASQEAGGSERDVAAKARRKASPCCADKNEPKSGGCCCG